MHRITSLLKVITWIICFSSLISCSYLQKTSDKMKNRNQIEGEGAGDISHLNLGGHRGSDSGSIRGLKTIFFNLDSSSLSSETKATLRANRDWLKKNPRVKKMELEGHCDSLGSQAYNIGLGQKRARQVFNYMKSIGVSKNRMNIISYGEEKPLSSINNTRNRRVNFVPIY